MGMRTCTLCGESKPLEAFAFKNKAKGIRRAQCKECVNAIQRADWHEHHDAHITAQRHYRFMHPELGAREYIRYHNDADFRARKIASSKASYYRRKEARCTCTN